MKIYIIGPSKEIKSLSENISKILNINVFDLENINSINEHIKTYKKWIIISNNDNNFDIISNQSNIVIYLNYKNSDIRLTDKLTKYRRKIIIIKNKKEEKILLKAVIEGHDFYL